MKIHQTSLVTQKKKEKKKGFNDTTPKKNKQNKNNACVVFKKVLNYMRMSSENKVKEGKKNNKNEKRKTV